MKTFNFFFGLHLSKRFFAHTDNLSMLQSPSLSAAAGQHLANLTVETLQNIRNEASLNTFYDVFLIKVNEYLVIGQPIVQENDVHPNNTKLEMQNLPIQSRPVTITGKSILKLWIIPP